MDLLYCFDFFIFIVIQGVLQFRLFGLLFLIFKLMNKYNIFFIYYYLEYIYV